MPELILDAASIWISHCFYTWKSVKMVNSMKNVFGLLWNYLLFVSFDCHSTSNFLVDWHCTQLEFGSGEGSLHRAELGLAQEVDQEMCQSLILPVAKEWEFSSLPGPFLAVPASSLVWNKVVAVCERVFVQQPGEGGWTLDLLPPSLCFF